MKLGQINRFHFDYQEPWLNSFSKINKKLISILKDDGAWKGHGVRDHEGLEKIWYSDVFSGDELFETVLIFLLI